MENSRNIGLNLFGDTDDNMTFREWRRLMSDKTGIATADDSNMEKLDTAINEIQIATQTSVQHSIGYFDNKLKLLQGDLNNTINTQPNDNTKKIIIGGGLPSDFTLELNDGNKSSMQNGVLSFIGGKFKCHLRFPFFNIESQFINGKPHLTVQYDENNYTEFYTKEELDKMFELGGGI